MQCQWIKDYQTIRCSVWTKLSYNFTTTPNNKYQVRGWKKYRSLLFYFVCSHPSQTILNKTKDFYAFFISNEPAFYTLLVLICLYSVPVSYFHNFSHIFQFFMNEPSKNTFLYFIFYKSKCQWKKEECPSHLRTIRCSE